jgi:uncharacterized protein (DUF1499 family)
MLSGSPVADRSRNRTSVESNSLPRPIARPSTLIAALLFLVLVVPVALTARVPEVGLVDDTLRPCSASPDCVSSRAEDAARQVAPLAFAPEVTDVHFAFQRFLAAIEAAEGSHVALREPNEPNRPPRYAHAVFVSPYLRLRGDVEFLVDPEARCVHVRAASRIGLGSDATNRARVEQLRALLAELR